MRTESEEVWVCNAIAAGNLEIVRGIIEQNSSAIHQRVDGGDFPIHIAVRNGHTAIVELLLQKGANVNDIGNKYQTPLMLAAQYGYLSIVELLTQQVNININQAFRYKNEYGTAIYLAAREGKVEVVMHLKEKGAEVYTHGFKDFSLLVVAAEKGHLDIIKYFAEKFLEELKEPYNQNLLSTALQNGHTNSEERKYGCCKCCWSHYKS